MPKEIYIKDLVNNKDYDLTVEENLKISELKGKVENIIGRKINNKLMIKKNHKNNATSLNDEDLTVKEAHIKNGDTIIVGKQQVQGGKILYKRNYSI